MDIFQMRDRNPWTNLLLLMLITVVCVFFVSMLIALLGSTFYGTMDLLNAAFEDENASIDYHYYVPLALSTIGTFLLPAYVFQRLNKQVTIFPIRNRYDWKVYFLVLMFLFTLAPSMSLIAHWNMQMEFPDAWEGIEKKVRAMENEMETFMKPLLMTNEWDGLLINIVVLAVLPAVGEELFFRGAIQHIATRIFRSEYIAIWVVAFVFSAIHFQFYGFFPRLLLGAFFGYLVVWTRNIWTAVFAHFVNNSMVVILCFYYALQGKTYSDLVAGQSYSLIVYLGSLIFSLIIGFIFYQYVTRIKLYGKRVD